MALDRSSVDVHRPILLREVLACLDPRPGDIAVDCTIGSGSHARAILERISPGGRLIGLDLDAIELERTRARFTADGAANVEAVTLRHGSFRNLRAILEELGVGGANIVFADLGVSSMQHDNAARGFHYKFPGPLDMRMDRSSGETAAELIGRLDAPALAELLAQNADEPRAAAVSALVKRQPVETTHHLERVIRAGLSTDSGLSRKDIKLSVRRTFQALRIAVNGELRALEVLLASLPECLAPGGRAAIISFHSGEDNRVAAAFQAGYASGVYSAISQQEIRTKTEETRANRRALSAKLRWAIRA